jgi:uncharacterized protein (DUF1330 family)
MKARYRLALVLFSGVALAAMTVTGLKAQAKPPVYVVIEISKMMDAAAYKKAVVAAGPATKSAGGRFIIRSAKPVALDGVPPYRFVVVAFDSEEKARAWRDSPVIQKLRATRAKTTESRSFMVEGLAN